MQKLLAVCLLFIAFTSLGQARRALSLMDKQKYAIAFELLENGLIKDTTSASIPFVLSKLYLIDEWPQSNLDSAFYFSWLSLANYDRLDEKQLDRHIKDNFGKTRLYILKEKIDSIAFSIAKTKGGEHDFQVFINQHTDAKELDSAVFLRNEQAYILAAKSNSLQSYKQFLDTYPEAKDWVRADANYQKLLFNENTSQGKLKEYTEFVSKYPFSPYYDEAIGHIYRIEIGRNSVESILRFIKKYPKSKKSKEAQGLLYHLHLSQEPATSFVDKYPKISIGDSLKLAIADQEKTLIPIWNSIFFQLISINKNVQIDSISSLESKNIYSDFVTLEKNGLKQMTGKNGAVFHSGHWQTIEKEEKGFVFIKKEENTLVIHKNGSTINGGIEANLVGPYLGYMENKLWGLKSITSIDILPPIYDSIWFEHDLIFLSTKNQISPNKPDNFYPALDGMPITIEAFYDDYEWMTNELLWVTKGEKEGLYAKDLEELIPLDKHQVDLANSGWSIQQKNKINIPEFSASALTVFEENHTWQIGKLKDSIIVKYLYDKKFHPLGASLLGNSAILMNSIDSSFVYITDSIRFYKPENYEVKPLFNQSNEVFYFEISEDDSKWIFNSLGEKLSLPDYRKIIPLNQSFFQLDTKSGKSLYSSSGDLLMEEIDGASLINDSTISILKEQHFGVLQPNDSVLIEANYSQRIVPISDSLWVISVDHKLGLIDSKEQELLSPQFDEITYWTNGLILLKKNLKWNIYDLKKSKYTEFGIVFYASITNGGSPIISYQKGVGVGIYDSQKGVVLKPTYTAVNLEGNPTQPYYRAEKFVEEAGLHIMLYYNMDGKQFFQNILDEKSYSTLFSPIED